METSGRVATAAGALAVAVLLMGCGNGPSSPTSPEVLFLRLETQHFRLFGDRVTDDVLRGVADRMEANFDRVLADLSVGGVQPVVVRVWRDQASWDAAVRAYFGRSIYTEGYVTGPDEVRVLDVPNVARNATHEFCHTVSLHVNPSFDNNPRWLWESVALYENGEWVDPRTLSYMVNGNPPTLEQLNADVSANRQVYEVGYLIGEFVVARVGQPALVQLIRSSGDTSAVLGMSPQAFQAAWYAFVRERYLS